MIKFIMWGPDWGGANGLNNTGTAENPSYASAFEYSSGFSEERMNSYFGRLTYNYKEKYLFEATLRRMVLPCLERMFVGQHSLQ